jgi:hypothetical protein
MTSESVIMAGRKAHGEIIEDTMPPEGSPAWKIIMAGRKARGEI